MWVDADDASLISVFGDYKHHGDLVEVTGTFNAACPLHGGDMDIHATSLRIVRPGYATVRQVRPVRMIAGAILAGLTLLLFLVNLRTDRRADREPAAAGAGSNSAAASWYPRGVIGIKGIDGGRPDPRAHPGRG